MENSLNFLSTRGGFNIALKHFKLVNKFIKYFQARNNLADLINDSLDNKQLSSFQISSILNALLIDKYGYYAKSFTIKNTFPKKLTEISKVIGKWDVFDIILSYHHPQLGQVLINPKNEESWESIDSLKENELVVVYLGDFANDFDLKLAEKGANAIEVLINGGKPAGIKSFEGSSGKKVSAPRPPERKAQVESKVKEAQVLKTEPRRVVMSSQEPAKKATGKKKLSPRYGVLVSNELFHNGNVEAWKKIIKSYEMKYSGIKVLVFYEGEQIHDINTLFKWGKVKHGTNIYFALLGSEFKDISKLRRYLAQGASPRFEDFLKGDPTKHLSLF